MPTLQVTSKQGSQHAACWLCMQAVQLHGQANCNGQWHCQQQKQNLLQPVSGPKGCFG